MKENAEIINLLMGIITKETLINEYVPFVSDAQAEIEKVQSEEDPYQELEDYDYESVPPGKSVTGQKQLSVLNRVEGGKNELRRA
jgi:hypothetical protein